jgi:hypothetical protein
MVPRIVTDERLDMDSEPSQNETSDRPSHEEIAALAQRYYDEEGQPEGRAEEHWTRAEIHLRQERQSNSMTNQEAPASSPETAADSGEELS